MFFRAESDFLKKIRVFRCRIGFFRGNSNNCSGENFLPKENRRFNQISLVSWRDLRYYSNIAGENFMWKKLLVFSVTFCLSLIFAQIKITSIEKQGSTSPLSNSRQSNLSENSQTTRSEALEKKTGRFFRAGVDNDRDVKDFYLKFQKAVAENDKEMVASSMLYPLNVTFPTDNIKESYRQIKDRKAFLRFYDRIFDKRLKDFIAEVDVEKYSAKSEMSHIEDDIYAGYDGIFVGRRVISISVYYTSPLYENNKYLLGIRTIEGNSQMMDLTGSRQ